MAFRPLIFLSLFLLLCLNSPARAQEFSSIELPFPQEENIFLIQKGDSLLSIGNKMGFIIIENKIEPFSVSRDTRAYGSTDKQVTFQYYTPIQIKENTYFIQNGLGKVYQWNENKITRMDKSFSFRNHFGNNLFEHEGQIYSYGGYGFWSFHDFMIRYSESMKEWNIHSHPSVSIPPGRKGAFFHKTENEFIAFGGEGSDGFLQDAFSFNFKQNGFENLGEISPQFPYANATKYNVNQNNVRYYFMYDLRWLKLDFDEFTFQLSSQINGLKEHSLSSNLLIHNGQVHFVSYRNNVHRLNTISLEKLNTLFGPPKKLLVFNQLNFLSYGVFILVSLLFVRFLIVFIRWRNIKRYTPLLQRRYLTYKKSILILSDEEKSILEFLMNHKKASSQKLAQLNCYTEYSDSYKLIAVLNDLKSLTKKLKNNKTVSKVLSIEKTTDDKDRRQKKYALKGKLFVYRGLVNHYFNIKP